MPLRFTLADLPQIPWKNRGGSTREVVCQPFGAGMEAFDWRVSIATIAQSGPFSVFSGIDRTIMLLGGDGVQLNAPGHFDHRLDVPGQPFAFAGDVAVDCTLLGGESTDFNVMTRRGVARSDVQVHTGRATLAPATAGVLLALDGDWCLNDGNALLDVAAGQGLWWANAQTAWACSAQQSHARLLSVRISPIQSGFHA